MSNVKAQALFYTLLATYNVGIRTPILLPFLTVGIAQSRHIIRSTVHRHKSERGLLPFAARLARLSLVPAQVNVYNRRQDIYLIRESNMKDRW